MIASVRTPRTRLFASTRVIARPHIGTFFGWIKPIVELSQTYDVTLLLCDHQSFDGHSLPTPDRTRAFKATLQEYFPESVVIISESEIEGLEALLPLFLRMASTRRVMRNPTLKALEARGELTLGHMTYPSLMAADLVALEPDEIVANAQGFAYHEYPFALTKRTAAIFGRRYQAPRILALPRVAIVDDLGQRLRRSSDGPVLGNTPDDIAAIERWLLSRSTPTPGAADQRWVVCRAPRSVWMQMTTARPPCREETSFECEGCLPRLCGAVRSELAAFRPPVAKDANGDASATLNACGQRLDEVFQRWSLRAGATDARETDAVAFVPVDVAGAELACWIVLSFAQRAKAKKGRRPRVDLVLMPPNEAEALTGNEHAVAQLERLISVAAQHGIDCRITTLYHTLKPPGALVARLYTERAKFGAIAAEGLREGVDRHLLAVLMDQYAHADQLHLTSATAPIDRVMGYNRERSGPAIINAWELLEPVAGRLYDTLETVIRKYPSATSFDSGGEAAGRLLEIHAISTEWWGEQAGSRVLSSFSEIKDRIVQNFRRIWRT